MVKDKSDIFPLNKKKKINQISTCDSTARHNMGHSMVML